jgi:hypothetical protein
VRGAERLDFRLSKISCADDDAGPAGQLEEDGKEIHEVLFW